MKIAQEPGINNGLKDVLIVGFADGAVRVYDITKNGWSTQSRADLLVH